MKWQGEDGWAITYSAQSPSWASFSGKKGGRILYERVIPMCKRQAVGGFELEYSEADRDAMSRIIDRLVRSLKDSGSGWQC